MVIATDAAARKSFSFSSSKKTVFRSDGEVRGASYLSHVLLQHPDIQDDTLGMLTRLLSRPADWEISIEGLISCSRSGKARVYRQVNEAIRLGFMARFEIRHHGAVVGYLYIASDNPARLAGYEPLTENQKADGYTASRKSENGKNQAASQKSETGTFTAYRFPASRKSNTTKGESNKRRKKEEELSSSRGSEPRPSYHPDFGVEAADPEPPKAHGAGQSTQPDSAGPEPAPSAPDGAGSSPPSSAAPLGSAPKRKRKPQPQEIQQMSEDWEPKEKTLATIMKARDVSRRQAELQAERFKEKTIANGNKYAYVNFDMALITWVKGKYYEPIPEITANKRKDEFLDLMNAAAECANA